MFFAIITHPDMNYRSYNNFLYSLWIMWKFFFNAAYVKGNNIKNTVSHRQKAKDTGSITILNPAPASKISDNDFKNIDYFTPNETEASFYLEKKIETKSEVTPSEQVAINLKETEVKNIEETIDSGGTTIAEVNDKKKKKNSYFNRWYGFIF